MTLRLVLALIFLTSGAFANTASARVGISDLIHSISFSNSVQSQKTKGTLEQLLEKYFVSHPQYYPEACKLLRIENSTLLKAKGIAPIADVLNGAIFNIEKLKTESAQSVDIKRGPEDMVGWSLKSFTRAIEIQKIKSDSENKATAFVVIYPNRFWAVGYNANEAKKEIIRVFGSSVSTIITTYHYPGSEEFRQILLKFYRKHPRTLSKYGRTFDQFSASEQIVLVDEVAAKLSHNAFTFVDLYESSLPLSETELTSYERFSLACKTEIKKKPIKNVIAPVAKPADAQTVTPTKTPVAEKLQVEPIQPRNLVPVAANLSTTPPPAILPLKIKNKATPTPQASLKQNKNRNKIKKPRPQPSRNRGSTKCFKF